MASFNSSSSSSTRRFNSFSNFESDFLYSQDQNGDISDGPLLPEDGFALRDWRRQNAIHLAHKETEEKEMLHQIIQEAQDYKAEFYRKRHIARENNKASNRDKEKLFLESQEKFHAEAGKNYWKAIAELIPGEVPAIERRGRKKKPSITVIEGPKPGKPTDISRMRQILGKLKHNPPPHMKPPPEPKKDSFNTTDAPSKAAATTPEAVAAT